MTQVISKSPIRRKGQLFRLRGLLGAALMAAFGIPALLSPPWLPDYPLAAAGIFILAWGCFLAGAGFRFWSILYLGGRKGKVVVDQGPYSLCRNPLYVGSFLLWCSLGLFLGSATFFCGVLLSALLYAAGTVPEEERYLGARLGQPYEDYKSRVPRFLPSPSLFRTDDTLEVSTAGLRGELRRASRWALTPVLATLVNLLRSMESWPTPLPLP